MQIDLVRIFKNFDFLLFFAIAGLLTFGLVALYSIGLGKEPQNFSFFHRQFTFFTISFPLVLFLSILNYRIYKNVAFPLYIGICVVLIGLLFFGTTVRGTRGWFYFGSLGMQPAELAKIGIIFILARYFSQYTRQVGRLRHIITSGFIVALPALLVLLQPDFGSALTMGAIWLGMLLVSGIPRRYTLSLLTIACILFTASWIFLFKDYQKDRILTFLFPASDTLGKGYNVRQAHIAIGAGQIFGRGLGSGSQSQLKFLPENQTDFIFSVIAEETGFLGVAAIFFFFLLLFYRLYRLLLRCRDDFALYCVLGISLLFLTQILLNIGGNIGLVPVTGLVLPFMSYGGSALLAMLCGYAIVQSIHASSV